MNELSPRVIEWSAVPAMNATSQLIFGKLFGIVYHDDGCPKINRRTGTSDRESAAPDISLPIAETCTNSHASHRSKTASDY